MPKPSSIDRTKITANVMIQITTVFLIVILVNYLAFNHYKRWDFSRDSKFMLADQTRRVLSNLKKPLKLTVFFSSGSDIARDVATLAKEYAYNSKKKLSLESVDPYLNLSRAREIASLYKLGNAENVIIVEYDGHTKIINAAEMAEYDPPATPMDQPRLRAFKGEQILTSALIEVTEHGANKMYLVTGHGEQDLQTGMYSGLKTYIERQNITLESHSLSEWDAVPEDARALLIAAPKYNLPAHDIQLLRAYWNKRGRIFLLFDPGSPAPGLVALLDDMGVRVNNDRVLKTVPYGPVTGVLKDITGDFVDGSPITRRLKNVTAIFMGGTQSLALDPERVKLLNIRLQPLIEASKGFWATANYQVVEGRGIYFNPKQDTASPCVAASVEKGALSDQRMSVDSSRMVVVGNSAFIRNDTMTESDLDFVMSSLNWLLNREHLMGVAAKPIHNFSLSLTEAQLGDLALLTLFAIPGAAAVFGIMAWLKRRR